MEFFRAGGILDNKKLLSRSISERHFLSQTKEFPIARKIQPTGNTCGGISEEADFPNMSCPECPRDTTFDKAKHASTSPLHSSPAMLRQGLRRLANGAVKPALLQRSVSRAQQRLLPTCVQYSKYILRCLSTAETQF